MIRRKPLDLGKPAAEPSPGSEAEREARDDRRLEQKRLELSRLETQQEALDLYLGGKSPRAVAEALGLEGAREARKLIEAAIVEEREDRRDRMRDVTELRLSKLLDANWEKAKTGDQKAGKMILEIIERQCLINGLNSPVEIKIQDELRAFMHVVKKFVGNEVYGQIVQELAGRAGSPRSGSPGVGREALPAVGGTQELH